MHSEDVRCAEKDRRGSIKGRPQVSEVSVKDGAGGACRGPRAVALGIDCLAVSHVHCRLPRPAEMYLHIRQSCPFAINASVLCIACGIRQIRGTTALQGICECCSCRE